MNEKIKRIAEEIHRKFNEAQSQPINPFEWPTYFDVVRFALEAIREPPQYVLRTPEGDRIDRLMQPARIEACRQTGCFDRGFDETDCGNCAACADVAFFVGESYWRAMIDALLKDD